MKRIATHLLAFGGLALAGIAVAGETVRPVPVNLEGVPHHLRARIEARANEGLPSLRRYLQSTQHLHGVRIEQVVRWDEMAAMANASREEARVADIGKKPTK